MTIRLVLALYVYRGQLRTQCLRNLQYTYVLRERRCSCLAREVEHIRKGNKDVGVYYRVIVLIILITPMSIKSPEGR
jgi:hypothetical protein